MSDLFGKERNVADELRRAAAALQDSVEKDKDMFPELVRSTEEDWVLPVMEEAAMKIECANGRIYELTSVVDRLRSIHGDSAAHTHSCPEWDGLTISEFDAEFNACSCFKKRRGAEQ